MENQTFKEWQYTSIYLKYMVYMSGIAGKTLAPCCCAAHARSSRTLSHGEVM
jgi:hypothetical protein